MKVDTTIIILNQLKSIDIYPLACGLPATVPSSTFGCLWFSVCHQLPVSSEMIQNSELGLRFVHQSHAQQNRMVVCFGLLFFVFFAYALSKSVLQFYSNHKSGGLGWSRGALGGALKAILEVLEQLWDLFGTQDRPKLKNH